MKRPLLLTIYGLGACFALTTFVLGQSTNEGFELRFERPFLAKAEERGTAPTRGGGGFSIVLDIGSGFSATQLATFEASAAAWEERISGYQPGISANYVTIFASVLEIDGEFGILGLAGPTATFRQAGYTVSSHGVMQFDTDDLARLESGGSLGAVIEHEIGHVLGIGTLWGSNGDYVDNSFSYTGTGGIEAWRIYSGQSSATSVPVEDDGGPGTVNGHWNEIDGGANLVGTSGPLGLDMRNALMTGWINAPAFYSYLTHGHLTDLGFTTATFPPFGEIFSDGFESGALSAWG